MTDEQINRAIAEACGWTQISDDGMVGRAPGKKCNRVMFVPLYCSNLNAMHEAEKMLNRADSMNFTAKLIEVLSREESYIPTWRASASQRAEAFLRTLGKWSADKDSFTTGATTEESSADEKEAQP